MNTTNPTIQLQGYTVLEQVYSPGRTLCYRAIRTEDQKRVILKLLRSEYPTTTELASLQQDYQLTKKLSLPGVVKAYDFQKYQNGFGLILEDTGGIKLKEYLEQNVVTIANFFKIAIQLVDTLSALHRNQIIHKDINPNNIIIHPETLETKLEDFSHASLLQYEIQELQNPNVLEATLAYMSPEQTGRMNRPVDYRTDLYSLGITFYEMLARRLPFQAKDPIGWVYSHIAETPHQLSKVSNDIPEIIAKIIYKLINKMPEDRYQSASGLKADLMICEDQWKKHQLIESFVLAQSDIRDTLQISQKLYGREKEVKKLLEAFERTALGDKECILITGNAGIGKSSLVQEIHKPITRQQGFFISGKFDPLKRNIPFSAIIDAFHELVQHWIAEPEEKILQIKKELLAVLGKSGQVLIDIIPDIELIIGKQPKAPQLNPTQAQNRFMILFRGFVQVFAKKEHPLILFLDDLQWVDSGSLKLIETLLLDSGIQYLLVIGSYRDNEVTLDHPLTITLHDLYKANVPIMTLNLEPLKEYDVEQLISDTLDCSIHDSGPLAKLIIRKTGGNPFFIGKILKILYQEKLLTFLYDRKVWEWDISAIEQVEIVESVVDLLVNNIQKLSHATQKSLMLASCIGNTFDLGILSELCNQPVKETALQIWEAIQADLIIPLGTSYKHVELLTKQETSTQSLHERINYKFSHDRIQQAAYSLTSEELRQKTHFRIAKILFQKYKLQTDGVDFFEMLNHFSQCLPLITDEAEKIEIAELSLMGGKKARLSTAYQTAITFLKCGINLLNEEKWSEQYELLFPLHKQLLECEYLTGSFQEAEELFDKLMHKAKTTLDKADLYYSKIKLYTNQGKLEEGCDIGLRALELFNIKIAKHPKVLSIIWNIVKVQFKLLFKPIKNLDLPEMTDREQLSIVQMFFAIGTAASAFNRKLFLITTCITTRKVLDYGYTDEAPLALCAYGMLLMNLGRHKKAKEFLQLGKRVGDKCGTAVATSRYFIPTLVSNYLYYPIPVTLELAKEAYQAALEAGELIFAAWSILAKIRAHNLMGSSISEMIHITRTGAEYVERIKYDDYTELLKIYHLYFLALASDKSKEYEELLSVLDDVKKTENKVVYADSHTIVARYNYIVGRYQDARHLAEKALEHEHDYRHHMLIRCELYYFYALSLAADYSNAGFHKKEYKKRIQGIAKKFKQWSTLCEYNFKDRYLLILAELARISGQHAKAVELYDQAIDAAHEKGFIYCIAIANERAAQFYFEINKIKIAKTYLLDAHYYFYRWGAIAKTQMLEKQHPEWFKTPTENLTEINKETMPAMATTNLNFVSILKASQAISSEIELQKLLQKIVEIAIENAGAERAMFIIKYGDDLIIEVAMDEGKKYATFPHTVIKTTESSVPHSVINSVMRNEKAVILNDASNHQVFTNDPYILTYKPKSILCMPIMHQSNLIGLLYLENNLTTEAFTSEHLKVLNLISTQAAISFENAQVYAATGRFVPNEFLDTLHKRNISEVSAGDNIHKIMSILFCDIRGFTSLSEKLTSAETFAMINSFFSCMEPYISAQKGFIDKYIGDAIMALFDGASDNAVSAGIDMLKALKVYQQKLLSEGKPLINIGIGINTGELMLGIVGSQHRIESTVIGDSVNVATRIETLNKKYGTSLLISEKTRSMLRYPERFHLRLIETTTVKGKKIPIDIWEIYDADPPEMIKMKDATLQTFNSAREHYQQKQWREAKILFEECLKNNPKDSVVLYYLNHCKRIYSQN